MSYPQHNLICISLLLAKNLDLFSDLENIFLLLIRNFYTSEVNRNLEYCYHILLQQRSSKFFPLTHCRTVRISIFYWYLHSFHLWQVPETNKGFAPWASILVYLQKPRTFQLCRSTFYWYFYHFCSQELSSFISPLAALGDQ